MILQIRNDCGHSGFAFSRGGVVVPSVCFTPWSGVRIPLTTAPASLLCTPLFVAMRHLPPTGGSLCSLAAVSSAAIPVRVKLKIPPSECSGSYHGRHSYRMGPATTTTAASGRCREELLGQRPARRTCRPRHARMLGAATRGTKKEPTGLFFAACGRPCSFDSSFGLHKKAPQS